MKDSNESLEHYLKGIQLPEHTSEGHRERLRGQILSRIGAPQPARLARGWKAAALGIGLLCLGVAAREIAVQVRHYFYEGKSADGTYYFAQPPSETKEVAYIGADGRTNYVHTSSSGLSSVGGHLDAAGIQREISKLDEIESLRQRHAGELVGIIDTKVNGKPQDRIFRYKYVFADGSTETDGSSESEAVTPEQYHEVDVLRTQGKYDIESVIDTEVDGQLQRTIIFRYILGDGRIVSIGEGDTNAPAASKFLTTEQINEVWRLKRLKEGRFVGAAKAQVYGRNIIFQKFAYKLADGTEVTMSEGEPETGKCRLNDANYEELNKLSGEALAAYEENIRGKLFVFKPRKYVLSDGTEFIRSIGELK